MKSRALRKLRSAADRLYLQEIAAIGPECPCAMIDTLRHRSLAVAFDDWTRSQGRKSIGLPPLLAGVTGLQMTHVRTGRETCLLLSLEVFHCDQTSVFATSYDGP